MSKTTSQDIQATLWKAAGTFRGTIDAANYKDFVLSMLFLKYLDDTYKEFLRELEEKYKGNQIRIDRAKKNLPFVLGEKERFDYLYDNRFDPKIGEMINTALQGIQDSNTELRGVFRSINFNSESMLGNPQQKVTKLRTLLEDFKPLCLEPSQIEVGPVSYTHLIPRSRGRAEILWSGNCRRAGTESLCLPAEWATESTAATGRWMRRGSRWS